VLVEFAALALDPLTVILENSACLLSSLSYNKALLSSQRIDLSLQLRDGIRRGRIRTFLLSSSDRGLPCDSSAPADNSVSWGKSNPSSGFDVTLWSPSKVIGMSVARSSFPSFSFFASSYRIIPKIHSVPGRCSAECAIEQLAM
jgi:hypothetical protein